jgi:AcrR family transcriptional regulator
MTHTNPPLAAKARPAKRRRDPQGTRDRLVRAALDLFTTQGYHASTTPQIAARAGVAEGTIYRHFPSKSQMLNEIYRGAVDLFARVIDEHTGHGPETYQERMSAIARRWMEVASRERELVKLVFVSPPLGELDGKSQAAFAAMRTAIERLLASGKSAGEVRPGPVDVWSDVWFQLIRLVLERVAAGTWAVGQTAPDQVVRSAWAAVALPSPTS